MTKLIGRNDLCPCGSGKKYKKCCINSIDPSVSQNFVDDEGLHFIGKGEKPNPGQLKKMEKEYQSQVRNSPLWDKMVDKYGVKKAEEMLKEFKVKTD